MAATTGPDFAGALKISSLTGGVININSNTGTAGFDVSGYTGTLAVCVSIGNGASGTVIVPSIKAGADTNVLNATNWVLNITNGSNVNSFLVANVDLRSNTWGATTNATGVSVINKYMYLTWLITGSATANSGLEATVIGQQKVSG